MGRSWLLTLALLAAVAALAWWAHFKPAPQAVALPLSSLRADAVSSVRIERSGRPPIELRRTGGAWQITAPLAAPAEPFQVERVLGILAAQATARIAAGDLARFDLDRPLATLLVDGQRFSFGAVNTTTREQYVLTQDGVFTVELRHGTALPSDAAQLVRRRLLAADELPAGFVLADFTLESRDGRWVLQPAPADVGADDLQRWVDEWRNASALRVQIHDGRRPAGEVRITLRDGRTLAIGILQREPELVLLRPDLNLQYAFVGGAARRLLAPPDAATRP